MKSAAQPRGDILPAPPNPKGKPPTPSAAQGHECDNNRALLPGTTKKPTDPQEQALLDRCTCDLARPYWHSFHREGCPLAR